MVIPGYRADQPRPHETVSKNIFPKLQLQSNTDDADILVGEAHLQKERKQIAQEAVSHGTHWL